MRRKKYSLRFFLRFFLRLLLHFLGHRFVGVFQLLENKVGSVHGSGMVTVSDVIAGVSGVFRSPETWIGVLVATAMIFGAIRIRRFRDDS